MKYHEIEGWFNYHDIYTRIVSMAPPNSTLVELGCWFGKSTVFMGSIIRGFRREDLSFHACDCFSSVYYDEVEKEKLKGRDVRRAFVNNMITNGLQHLVRFWNITDLELAKHFSDQSCYFVFIDSLHTYEHVKKVIETWLPKMQPGGYLCGHDLQMPEVMQAVKETNRHFTVEGYSFIMPI